jgi:dimethylamine/trimethylamine dehydrogenase
MLDDPVEILTPDDVMAGSRPTGNRVALFDDDHYYMGSAIAELLVKDGYAVTLVTPEPEVAAWTHKTMEQHRIQARLLDLGVQLVVAHAADRVTGDGLVVRCTYVGRERMIEGDAVVLVTSRLPTDELALSFLDLTDGWVSAGLKSVRAVGDALSPGSIAAAVWDGHRFAEDVGGSAEHIAFPRNVPAI